jgi:transcriptional regulator with XRE-family HTH domain
LRVAWSLEIPWEVVTVGETVVLRSLLGDALRETRLRQHRTLREVSGAARVSLGYLSEVERGQKEASSELLASICRALGVRLSDVLREVSDELAVHEPHPVLEVVPEPEPVGTVLSAA